MEKHPPVRRAALAVVAAAAATLMAVPAAQADGTFGCEASALRASVLGQPPVEPVVANGGGGACRDASAGGNAPLPAPLKASVVTATTTMQGSTATAQGGLADVRLGALPGLPLPSSALDGLGAVTVPLPSQVASAVGQAVSQIDGATGTVTGVVSGATSGGGTSGGDLLGTATGTVTGTVSGVLGGRTRSARTRALGDVVSVGSSSITLDLRPAIQALAAQAASGADILSAQVLQATATAQCAGGQPLLSGAAKIAGVKLAGQDTPVNGVVEQAVKLADTTSIDPSQIDLSQIQLPAGLSFSDPTIGPALQQAVRTALDALPPIQVPATVAQVKLTPDVATRSGDSLTEEALRVQVSVAGQSVLDATIGRATVSTSGNPCGAAPAAPQVAPHSVADASLRCTRRKLVLIDVLQRGGHVRLYGAADKSLVGRTARIQLDGGRTVAHARIRKDGTFATTAPLPPRSIRYTNDARYRAVVGHERSLNLKLHRRLLVRSTKSANGRVTIAGRVVLPLGKPIRTVTIKQRVTCRSQRVVKRFKPRRDGTFRVTLRAPKGFGVAVYRFQTKVRNNRRNPKLFPTYTLPRAVELEQ